MLSAALYLVFGDNSCKSTSQLLVQGRVQIYHRLWHTVVLWTHKTQKQVHEWRVLCGLMCVYLYVYQCHLDQPSFNGNKHLNIPLGSGWILQVKPPPVQGWKGREKRWYEGYCCENAKAVQAWNSPALLSLELVGSAKNVAESSPWPQVQEAMCLQRNG